MRSFKRPWSGHVSVWNFSSIRIILRTPYRGNKSAIDPAQYPEANFLPLETQFELEVIMTNATRYNNAFVGLNADVLVNALDVGFYLQLKEQLMKRLTVTERVNLYNWQWA